MTIQFIGQGYNLTSPTSVGENLLSALADASFHTFKCMVAFASPGGVSGLAPHIKGAKAHLRDIRVIVGIDQSATSKEALECLLEWEVSVFVFYSLQPNIFHPKIYLFEGDEEVLVIVGSNNMTQMGLARNIEGAISVRFRKEEIDGKNLLENITDYFTPLLDGDNANLQLLTAELIAQLVAAGIVPNETVRRAKYEKAVASPQINAAGTSNDISTLFPAVGMQGLPRGFAARRMIPARPISRPAVPNPATPVPNLPAILMNNTGWAFTDTNQVLVAEIGGPSRWKQISFAKDNFETFFGLPVNVGTSGQISLKYIEDNGNVQNTIEQCTSARVKASKNFNLEPLVVRESTVPYDVANRPIITFIKINATNFIYHFETNGSQRYTELNQLLGPKNGDRIRRRRLTVAQLRANCPSINL